MRNFRSTSICATSSSTHADHHLREFVRDSLALEKDPLGRMHALMGALHDKLAFEPGETPAPRPAAEVFEAGNGSARELAQVMVAAAREDNAPARFISGFFLGGATELDGERRLRDRRRRRPSCLGRSFHRPDWLDRLRPGARLLPARRTSARRPGPRLFRRGAPARSFLRLRPRRVRHPADPQLRPPGQLASAAMILQ